MSDFVMAFLAAAMTVGMTVWCVREIVLLFWGML